MKVAGDIVLLNEIAYLFVEMGDANKLSYMHRYSLYSPPYDYLQDRIHKLSDQGIVVIDRAKNGRDVYVRLTPKGKKLQRELRGIIQMIG